MVTLGQFTALAYKRLSAIFRADHEQRRLYIAAALAAVVALAVCAPLAWSADIQAYDGHMSGTPGGALFPVIMTLTCLLGSTLLCFNTSFPKERRPVPPLWPGFLILLGLCDIAGMRFGVASLPPIWEFYVLIGFPALAIAIYMLALVLEAVDAIRIERADPRWREIRELRRRVRASS